MIKDPAGTRVDGDLLEGEFVNGLEEGHWRIISKFFPHLTFAIQATEPDGRKKEYVFRAELSNFPTDPPLVQIWDLATNAPLHKDLRPKGDERVIRTFQEWQDNTIYRPWDRRCGPHDGLKASNTHLAWNPDRRLSFIFRDLHGILNSNARAAAVRQSA